MKIKPAILLFAQILWYNEHIQEVTAMKKIFFLALLVVLFVGCANKGEAILVIENDTEITYTKYYKQDGNHLLTTPIKIELKPGATFTDVLTIPSSRCIIFSFENENKQDSIVKTLPYCFSGIVYKFKLSKIKEGNSILGN